MTRPSAHAAPPAFPPALDFAYADATALSAALADPHTLAVFGFGADVDAAGDDPRHVQVPLRPLLGANPLEIWRSPRPVAHGREDGVAWAADGALLFGALELDEVGGDIESAAAEAYARLAASLPRLGYPHLLRIWNHLDAITEGEGDDERYRRFCIGRVRGLGGAVDPSTLPAATAVGCCNGRRRLQVYWLAARAPGTPLENPRQVNAWRYPRMYGPQSPSFARAMLPPDGAAMPLLLSGTAAIVGHASRHSESLEAQLEEIFANFDSLFRTARRLRPALPPAFGAGSLLKVYVRDAEAGAQAAAWLDTRLGDAVPRILLHASVCRRELRIEIEGVHGPL